MIVRLLLGLALTGGVVGIILYRQARRDPSWYPRPERDPARIDQAAVPVENTLIELRNWAGAWAGWDARVAKGKLPASSQRQPAEEFTAVMRGSELTAFVLKWTRLQGWDATYSRYVTDPALAVVEGRLVVVGRVAEGGMTISLHYRPELLAGGKMAFHLERVMVGSLAVPGSVGEDQLGRVSDALGGAIKRWRAGAAMDRAGEGNASAMLAAVGEFSRGLVHDEPVDAVGFVPVTEKSNLPVEITGLTVEGDGLRVTLRPVPREDRAAFLARLKGTP